MKATPEIADAAGIKVSYTRAMWNYLQLVVSIFAIVGPNSQANGRTWTDSGGKHQIEAEYFGYENGRVKLKKTNGAVVEIAIEALSGDDQEFVRKQSELSAVDTAPAKTQEIPDSSRRLSELLLMARDAIENIPESSGSKQGLLLEISYLAASLGDRDAAKVALREAVSERIEGYAVIEQAKILLRVDGLPAALTAIRATNDLAFKADALGQLAVLLVTDKQTDHAAEILAEAASLLGSVDAYKRNHAVVGLVRYYVMLGDVAGAQAMCKFDLEPDSLANALGEISALQLQQGKKKDSEVTLDAALAALRSYKSHIGDAGSVDRETAKRMQFDQENNVTAQTLSDISTGQFRSGNKAVAKVLARNSASAAQMIQSAHWKKSALLAAAEALMSVGSLDDATALAKKVGDVSLCELSLSEIAVARARGGKVKEALLTARALSDAGWRLRALAGIAEIQTRTRGKGDPKVTFREAVEASKPSYHDLEFVAFVEAKSGLLGDSVKLADLVTDPRDKAAVLLAIVRGSLQRNGKIIDGNGK